MKRLLCVCLMLCLGLTACRTEEVIEPDIPDMSERYTEYTYANHIFKSPGYFCGYIETDLDLEIFPFFNLEPHIEVRVVSLSDNNYWEAIKRGYPDAVLKSYDNFEILVLDTGETFGCYPNGETSIFCYSNNLPSGYMKEVLSNMG